MVEGRRALDTPAPGDLTARMNLVRAAYYYWFFGYPEPVAQGGTRSS